MNRNFAHLRFENKALYFNDIADIPLFKETVFFFTEIVKLCKIWIFPNDPKGP